MLYYIVQMVEESGYYSFRYFDGHSIKEIFGGDEWIFKTPPCSSLALAYGTATEAAGWKINRHEGKLMASCERSPHIYRSTQK